jgi:RimJ/RimL family protein N-acetyltransferase
MKILETERLALQTIGEDDADFYLQLVNEPTFLRYIGDKGVRTRDDAVAAILNGPMKMQSEKGFSLYLVVDKASGERIGMSGLIKRPELEDVDLGYAFLPAHWGKGYAIEAARAVVEHARRDVALRGLAAITSPDNDSSIQLLLKLGYEFRRVIHMRADDSETNLYHLTLG